MYDGRTKEANIYEKNKRLRAKKNLNLQRQ